MKMEYEDVRAIALTYVRELRSEVAATDAAALAEKCGSDVETIGAYKAHALRACETVIDLICMDF